MEEKEKDIKKTEGDDVSDVVEHKYFKVHRRYIPTREDFEAAAKEFENDILKFGGRLGL